MLTVVAKSVNGSESTLTEQFVSLDAVREYVPREFRGLSSLYAVRVRNDKGWTIAHGHRAGMNGTGETWTWDLF